MVLVMKVKTGDTINFANGGLGTYDPKYCEKLLEKILLERNVLLASNCITVDSLILILGMFEYRSLKAFYIVRQPRAFINNKVYGMSFYVKDNCSYKVLKQENFS